MSPNSTTTRDTRWFALVVLCAGMLMIILDSTIVNVALPSIRTDLGFSQASLAWVVNAYLVAFGGLLLLAGRIGDLFGRKRVFLTGLGVFTAASLLCGISTSQELLIAARFLQGAGGALTSSVILGMVVTMFPEPRERTKAIGIYSFVASAGASLGLLLGGLLTQGLSWHWIFFVNLPIGVVAGLLALRLVEDDRGLGARAGADVLGGALITAGLMLAVYTIVETDRYGWASAHTLVAGVIALALLAGFAVRQVSVARPLLPPRVLASRNVLGGNLTQVLMTAGMLGTFFIGVLFMQGLRGYDPIQIGLAFLPVSLGIGVLSLGFSGRLISRFGGRAVLLPSLLFIAGGLLLFARTPAAGNYFADLFPAALLLGIGAGLAFPAMMTLAMSTATPEDAGLVSGLVNTTQQVGGAVGLAVLATLTASRTEHLASTGHSASAALIGGYHFAYLIAAGVVLVGAVIAATVLQSERRTTDEPTEVEREAVELVG